MCSRYHYVDDNVDIHEEFIYQCPGITADTIVAALHDTLLRLNLRLSHCHGQCYDGGSNMASREWGVGTYTLYLDRSLEHYLHIIMDVPLA